jgi:hypothetical protein
LSADAPEKFALARNYYSEINLHITKESSPLLVPKVEAIAHHYLRGRGGNGSSRTARSPVNGAAEWECLADPA